MADAPLGERRKLLCDYAAAQALRVLGLDSSHTIKLDQPSHELGLDSLMAVELRNLLGSGLELEGRLACHAAFRLSDNRSGSGLSGFAMFSDGEKRGAS